MTTDEKADGSRRPRGTGSLFWKNDRWWIKYYVGGRPIRESTGTDKRRTAEKFLSKRLAEVRLDRFVGVDADRLTFEELAERLQSDYKTAGRRSLARIDYALLHLKPFFGGFRAVAITPTRIRAYRDRRLAENARPGTVRIELAALKRAFRLAVEDGSLGKVPTMPTVPPAPAREGFFEEAEVEALANELPEALRPVLRFAVLTGWRLKEITGLTWDRVDFAAGVVRLEGRHTKNAEAREFPVSALPALEQLLRSQRNLAETIESATGKKCPYVFHRFGRPIRSHYAAWRAACGRAGLAGRLLHDCRRTAVRNLERAGVSRSVAMKLTGHKTEAVYRRYAIVSAADLREGVAKLARMGTERAPAAASNGDGAGEQAS